MVRKKVNVGDIFYVPLIPPKTHGRMSEYTPDGQDSVTYGQILSIDYKYSVLVAFFDVLTKQAEAREQSLVELAQSPVFLIGRTSTAELNLGYWPILGNFPVRASMPFQAYVLGLSSGPMTEVYNTDTGAVSDSRKKLIPTEKAANLMSREESSTGLFQTLARYKFGLISEVGGISKTKEESDTRLKNFFPRQENTLEHIFPENYPISPYEK